MNFRDFFGKATRGAEEPFPYQQRFANAAEFHDLVHAPTGSGKTATAILGWLWRYFHTENPTPRRLAYCLPMRVLVEQTASEAKKWIAELQLPVSVHVLMGGDDAEDWDLDPEKPTILIGTQDMLLSRALNRGYGMSRYRWPMHFGLLNNDCLWVLDEIQLMGVGLTTSTQLQAFRERFGTFGKVRTVWMSATLRPDWLATVDFRDRVPNLNKLSLTDEDYKASGLKDRWNARKLIEPSGLKADDSKGIASLVKSKHLPGSLTLVVVNTVDRSRKLFEELRKLYQAGQTKGRGKKSSQPGDPAGSAPHLKLIHSRFRPLERERWMEWLKEEPPREGRIVASTQVVEAGVDMSARTLFTELAPWPSLVQRFGRCNRRGEFKGDSSAHIYWVDVPAKDDKQAAPYAKSELDEARKHLKALKDGGPRPLHEFLESLSEDDQATLFPFDPPHVVRRKDFVDLFD
ncbi:MAG TPA: DEAD/DEAH box helicase, partial [Isosphaeraceae bacterium]|nr:DEAD/DEAH box helicase [Isosphaeraceae bacterium]